MSRLDDDEYIYRSLLHLGAITWNRSAKRLLQALKYAISHDTTTTGRIKHIYNELASADDCTYSVIERSLRYAIRRMWECSCTECSKLLYRSNAILPCPSVSEFILLYSDAFKRGIIQAWVDSIEAEEPEAVDNPDVFEIFKI